MKHKYFAVILLITALSACGFGRPDKDELVHRKPWWNTAPFNWIGAHGNGQEVYHWHRPHTGIQKFSTDHSYCMEKAKTFKIFPATKKFFHNIFYTEEKRLDTRADWNGKSGIWASFIPYPGAQPLTVNVPTQEEDDDITPRKYVDCMLERGYTFRNYNIPEITNIYLRTRGQ
ncbi:MAG: hypothetical protein Q4D11_00245 [Rhodospirillales bacterium]|nr:hypothetical protein [Rhodospirillales bacterium]